MLRTLLESQAANTRRAGGTIVSVAVHLGVIALAIVATASATTARGTQDAVHPDITYVAPPAPHDATPSPTHSERTSGPVVVVPVTTILVPPITIPDHLPPIDLNRPPTDERDWDGKTDRLTRGDFGGGVGLAGPTDRVYTATLVEKAAAPQPGNPPPVYPAALRSAQIEGTVHATFVVDTSGRAEPATIHFTDATHPQFAEAVRQSLVRSRYLPAVVGGRAVRQLVEQRFAFTLSR